MNFTISDVKGIVGDADLSPLECALDVAVVRLGRDTLLLPTCDATIQWAGQELARVGLTGSVCAARETAALALTADVGAGELWQGLAGEGTPLNLRDTSMRAQLALSVAEGNSRLDCSGEVVLNQIGFVVPTGQNPPPLDLSSAFTLALDHAAQTLRVPRLQVTAAQNARNVLQVRNEEPLVLAFSEDASDVVAPERARLSVNVQALPLNQFNGFLVSNDIEISAGTLTANYLCDIIRLGEQIRLQGEAAVAGLNMRQGKARWDNLAVTETVDMSIAQFRDFTIQRMLATFSLGGRPMGELALGGHINLETLSNRVALAAANMRSELIRPLLDPTRENRRLQNLELTAQLLTESRDAPAGVQEVAANATIANVGRPGPGEWDRLTWACDARISPAMVALRECTVGLSPGQWEDNQLTLTGIAYLQPTSAVSTVMLASDHFDGTVLLDTLAPEEGKPVETPGASMPEDTAPGQEPAPAPLQGRNVDFKVRVNDLVLRDVRVRPVHMDVTLADSVLSISTEGTRINEGDLGLMTRANLGVTGYQYSARVNASQIPLQPIVDTFVPKIRGNVAGTLVGTGELAGRGLTQPNLKRFLKGTSRFDIEDGHLFNIPVFDRVGAMIGNDSLRRLSFSNAVAAAAVSDGVVTIKEMDVSGKTMNVGMDGTITLDKQLDLAMHLGFSGQQMMSMVSKIYPAMPRNETLHAFYDIPIPIRIKGTLGDPQITTSMTELAPAMATAVGLNPADQLGALIDQVPMSDEVKEGVKTLKDLLLDQLKQDDRGTR
jgi:hypothetical protein